MAKSLRRALDALYTGCGMIAAGCLVAMLGIILAQMIARWSGLTFPGAANYAGYAMASASFFAFAHALDRAAHIRVGILLNIAGPFRRWLELWCYGIGTLAGWFLARYAVNLVLVSYRFGDVSQGQDATPLWIPQTMMAIGAIVFAIALSDKFLRVLLTGDAGVRADTVRAE